MICDLKIPSSKTKYGTIDVRIFPLMSECPQSFQSAAEVVFVAKVVKYFQSFQNVALVL